MSTTQTEMSPQAVRKVLNWKIKRVPIQLEDGTVVPSHFATTREVDGEQVVLGVVGRSYQLIQNSDVPSIAESICEKNRLRFTNAGIIRDGQRIFFQCAGAEFSVGRDDTVTPYMLFVNAHDGSMACRMCPMTERMVCANQLSNMLDSEASWVSIRHSGDITEKLKEVGRLGRHFTTVAKANRGAMLQMRQKQVTAKQVGEYFGDLYVQHFGVVNLNPQERSEELSRARADKAYEQYLQRFEADKSVAGTTAWNMANAYSGWLQHEHRAGRDPARSAQRRLHSSLFGINAERSVHAFQVALNL